MAKPCTSIVGLKPAYGTILVVPENRDRNTATITMQVSDQQLPRGKVVAIGDVPRRYRKVPIGIGSTIAYARAVTQSIPVEINGQMTQVVCVMWLDHRASWVDENNSDESSIRIRDIFAFSAGFAAGIAFSYRRYWIPFVSFCTRAIGAFRKRDKGVVPGEGEGVHQ